MTNFKFLAIVHGGCNDKVFLDRFCQYFDFQERAKVELRFEKSRLERLYLSGAGARQYPANVIKSFIRKVRIIESAKDERDLRALKSLHFEKLRSRKNQYSIRLNEDWRLILRFEKTKEGKIVVIIDIDRHYGD